MRPFEPNTPAAQPDSEEQAAEAFVTRRSKSRREKDESHHAQMPQQPGAFAAHQKVARIWEGIGASANRPEFLALREQALARARRANRRRWYSPWTASQRSGSLAAGIAGVALVACVIWQLSPYGYRPGVYQTGIGEQRTIELSDHSRIALDSSTRIRVTLTADARTVEITQGQAQFVVAHEVARPFKVIAGSHTIVDVGTVFTVDYEAHYVHVAMMEGRVAVLTQEPQASSGNTGAQLRTAATTRATSDTIELSAGEELQFSPDGRATVTSKADLEAATAWREGKVIFHAERLGEAVRRLNRYSRVQLRIEGAALSDLRVSGVFEAGDNRGFAVAVAAYLPVVADYSQNDLITLSMK